MRQQASSGAERAWSCYAGPTLFAHRSVLAGWDTFTPSRWYTFGLSFATAEEVKAASGFAIGGVPPLGHVSEMRVFVDETLLNYEQVWAAAGHPNSVFPVDPRALTEATGGQVADLKEK